MTFLRLIRIKEILRCHQGLGILSSELRTRMSKIKEKEGGDMQKEEANILLHVSHPLTLTIWSFMKFDVHFKELERRGPLTGLGFFTIERSTITGMLSTAVTYIIILVQFRMSTWYSLLFLINYSLKHRKNSESCPTHVTWKVKF